MTHQDCIESLAAEGYILGELSAVDRLHFEEHYFECPECAGAVRRLLLLRDGVQLGPHRVVEPSRLRGSAGTRIGRLWSLGWLRPQLAFAAALGMGALVLIAGYQNLQLRSQLRPQSLSSILLRPETRGEVGNVQPLAGGQFVLLEADLPAASGKLTWLLRAVDSGDVIEGTAPAPELGLSFKLLVPAEQLRAGHYILFVRSETRDEWTFRFTTRKR